MKSLKEFTVVVYLANGDEKQVFFDTLEDAIEFRDRSVEFYGLDAEIV